MEKNSILVFPDGMHETFQTAKLLLNYKSEVLQIAKIAKEIREEIFAFEHFKFSGSFHKIARVHLCRTISSLSLQ